MPTQAKSTSEDESLEEFSKSEKEGEESSLEQHLEGMDLDEVKDYIRRTCSDELIDEFGGVKPFLDAVEEAEEMGLARPGVQEFIVEMRKKHQKVYYACDCGKGRHPQGVSCEEDGGEE